jgi:hypothetical protein
MNKQLHFTPCFDFSEIVSDKRIISSSVGPNGDAVLLAVEKKFEKQAFGRNERKGFASFPLSKARRSYPAVFIRYIIWMLSGCFLPMALLGWRSRCSRWNRVARPTPRRRRDCCHCDGPARLGRSA